MDEPKRLIAPKPKTLGGTLIAAFEDFEKRMGDAPEVIRASGKTIDRVYVEWGGANYMGRDRDTRMAVLGVVVRVDNDVPHNVFLLSALYSHA